MDQLLPQRVGAALKGVRGHRCAASLRPPCCATYAGTHYLLCVVVGRQSGAVSPSVRCNCAQVHLQRPFCVSGAASSGSDGWWRRYSAMQCNTARYTSFVCIEPRAATHQGRCVRTIPSLGIEPDPTPTSTTDHANQALCLVEAMAGLLARHAAAGDASAAAATVTSLSPCGIEVAH